MEAYKDVALFITPTRTASLSQLFLVDIEQNEKQARIRISESSEFNLLKY